MKFFPEIVVKAWVAGVLAGIYAPEPDEEIWEWANRTLRIPATENEELAGQFVDFDMTPYVKELMRWVKRPGKGEFWIKKSSQVGITMAVLVIVCWFIVHRSGNIAYAIDSITEARNISRTRLQKWIEDNSILDSIGDGDDDLGNLTYYLRNTTVYMLGAYSSGGFANKSTVLFILDELDKHPWTEGEGTTTDQARDRCKRPKNAKIIGFCTPGLSGLITKEHAAGTCEEIHVPCPHCGFMQPLKRENFVFGTKEFKDLADGYDLEKVLHGAYFQCQNDPLLCNGRIEEKHKAAILLKYKSVPTNLKAPAHVRSQHIWDAYSPFVSFGQLAVEWILAQGDPAKIERWIRSRAGEHYEKSGKALTSDDILKLKGDYKRGHCPFVPVMLAQTTDVQEGVLKSVKTAFNIRGDAYIIDWRPVYSDEDIIHFADEPVFLPNGQTMIVGQALVDEGHRMIDIRRLCLANLPRFWPIKGRGEAQARSEVWTSMQYCDGHEMITYHCDDPGFKWKLLYMISDNEKLKRKGFPTLVLPSDVEEGDGDELVDELTNERPVKKMNKFGRPVWEWVVPKGKKNDYWDCVKYALALWAIMAPALRAQHGMPMEKVAPEPEPVAA